MELEPGSAKDSNVFFLSSDILQKSKVVVFSLSQCHRPGWCRCPQSSLPSISTWMIEAQGCEIIEVLSREKCNEVLIALYSYISSQGSSLLSAYLSSSDVTDYGLLHIKEGKNVEALNLNFYEHISDVGLGFITGLSNLISLSLKKNTNITTKGCSGIHGGLVHLRGLHKLALLNMERFPITATCLDLLSDLVALLFLNEAADDKAPQSERDIKSRAIIGFSVHLHCKLAALVQHADGGQVTKFLAC
ncbi:unnamed protein product [Lactuca saligna]|uniref:Uncharacterized protein n=1 Tax=Lactuca saligna TaxID=75948 RepID=A0AA35YPZ2_LACSI|nr:unnamed protein product [Lactuca saligna]